MIAPCVMFNMMRTSCWDLGANGGCSCQGRKWIWDFPCKLLDVEHMDGTAV